MLLFPSALYPERIYRLTGSERDLSVVMINAVIIVCQQDGVGCNHFKSSGHKEEQKLINVLT